MAFRVYGIWALVAQQLTNAYINTLILCFTVKWHPRLSFSIESFKKLYRFGFNILTSRLVDVVYNNLRQMLIGKIYTLMDLAYYNRGQQIPNMVMSNVNSSLDSVLFPVMSKSQNDIERIKRMTKRATQVGSFLLWPVMAGIIAIAEFLRKRLDTVYNQTYSNYEVILLDDNSTDGSQDIIKKYAERNDRKDIII